MKKKLSMWNFRPPKAQSQSKDSILLKRRSSIKVDLFPQNRHLGSVNLMQKAKQSNKKSNHLSVDSYQKLTKNMRSYSQSIKERILSRGLKNSITARDIKNSVMKRHAEALK